MAYAYSHQPWNAQRFVALCGAIAVNVGFFVAFSSGLTFSDFAVEPPPIIDVVPVPENTAKPLPRPVEPPDVDRTTFKPDEWPELPPIDWREDAVPPVRDAPELSGSGDGLTGRGPVIGELQVDPAFFTPPMYPRVSIERNEQGTVRLLIYVLPDGSVGDIRIAQSSGYQRLDQAARKAAKTQWRFRPRTQNGAAVAAWGTYAVTFQIR